MTNRPQLKSRRIQLPDSFQAVQDYCWEHGWTDGLPSVSVFNLVFTPVK